MSRARPAFALTVLLTGLLVCGTTRPDAGIVSRCGAAPAPEEVLRRLNEARARGASCQPTDAVTGAAPLQWSASLAAVASAQSQEMAQQNQMSHRDRLNRGLGERLGVMGYRFSAAVENVAVGYASLDAVVEAWLDSETHCANLMNPKVREFGLACVDDGNAREPSEGRYWTLVLGAPPRAR